MTEDNKKIKKDKMDTPGKTNNGNDDTQKENNTESLKQEKKRGDGNHAFLDRLDLTILVVILLLTIHLRLFCLQLPDEMYFDEVHYIPAARDYIEGRPDINYIHPPLAKEIMAGFMRVFGDSSFGWRIGSVVFGSLMVLMTYLLALLLFKNRFIAAVSSLLLGIDFLHIVQSRIATLDIYIAFFTLGGYYFTWLAYLAFSKKDTEPDYKLKSPILYLLAAGALFGGAVAVKVSGIFGPAGAFLFLALALYLDRKEIPLKQLGQTALFFTISMTFVYIAAHIPLFLLKEGRISPDYMLYQRTFKFHYTEEFTHPYLSQVWQWPTLHRPIWYHWNEDRGTDTVAGILAVGNPLFWWSFLAVLVDMIYRAFRDKDRRIIFILCAYLTLVLFWYSSFSNYGGKLFFKGGFFYYMLPAVPFMAMAVAETLNDLRDSKLGKVSIGIFLVGIIVFLFAFYPILTALRIPKSHFNSLMKIGVFKTWI